MGPPGGMFLAGYPAPPPAFMPNFGMQGGALPMMGFPPPFMIPNPTTGKPMLINPLDAMQMQQMMQMGGPQLPPQMAPHNPILFAPGPYSIPTQAAQGYVDVNGIPQGVGYRPQQVQQPNGGRDFNQRPHVGNNLNSNFNSNSNGSNNNRYMNSGNFNGSRNGSNYNSSNNNQGGSRQQQNNNRNPRGNTGGNYFYNRNNNFSGSSNNSGVGNSNDQANGWQESGSSPSAELDGGSVGDNNFTLNASMSSQSSSVEGRNNEKLNISTEGISTNETRSPSNRSYGGDQGHRGGAYDNNYSGGNANNYNRNTQYNNSTYNHNYNRVNGGDVTSNLSNMTINRTDHEIRNASGGGRGNFRTGSINSSAYNNNNQRIKTGASSNKPTINSNNSQPAVGESISKEGSDITGLAPASTNGRSASGSSADLKPVRRSGSNVGISESEGITSEEHHANAPRGNNLKSGGAAAGDSRGKGAATNNPAGRDGKDAKDVKEKDKERSREREREKGDRSGSKRGDKKDKKGGDADKAKKVAPPIAEFNLEADFPNLVCSRCQIVFFWYSKVLP